MGVTVLDSGVVYENPWPQLRSRQAYFPSVCQLPNGELLCCFVLGEASDSVDQTSVISRSCDGGTSWQFEGPMYSKRSLGRPTCDFMKITCLPGGKVVAIGDRFERANPDIPSANPETGGQVPNEIIYMESADGGHRWSYPKVIPSPFKDPQETTCPLVVLSNGSWVAPIGNFPDWNGCTEHGYHGHLLRTDDHGKTWSGDAVTMAFPEANVTAWEQRLCEVSPGVLVNLVWCIEMPSEKRLPNHYTVSRDYGKTFSDPISTGIMGEASSVCCLGDNKLAALHCLRKGAERPGIYLNIIDFSEGKWDIVDQAIPWEPAVPIVPDKHGPQVFAYLKFGQPTLMRLQDGEYLMVHWANQDGQVRILWTALSL